MPKNSRWLCIKKLPSSSALIPWPLLKGSRVGMEGSWVFRSDLALIIDYWIQSESLLQVSCDMERPSGGLSVFSNTPLTTTTVLKTRLKAFPCHVYSFYMLLTFNYSLILEGNFYWTPRNGRFCEWRWKALVQGVGRNMRGCWIGHFILLLCVTTL